jgi:hypothetical protein
MNIIKPLIVALLWAAPAQAQCNGQFAPGDICGNPDVGAAQPRPAQFSDYTFNGKFNQEIAAAANPGELIRRTNLNGVSGSRQSGNGDTGYDVTFIHNDGANLLTGIPGNVVQMGKWLLWQVGGANAGGIRYGFFSSMGLIDNINQVPATFTPQNQYIQHEMVPVAAVVHFNTNLSMGGTDAQPWGNGIGIYGVCETDPGVGSGNRRLRSCVSAELDTFLEAGTNVDATSNIWMVTSSKASGVTVDAFVTMTAAASPGATGKNTGILFTNYVGQFPVKPTGTMIGAVGAATVANFFDGSSLTFTANIINTGPFRASAAGQIFLNGVQVVGPRITGYAPMTGAPNKAAVYDTASVTLPQLAGRVAQLQADLTTHGIIGP